MAKSGTPSKLVVGGTARSAETRRALVEAAIESLKVEGFAGSSARSIAERANLNQGLVFYHFGTVANLLLAALDAVSAERMSKYRESLEHVSSPAELMDVATEIFREDLDAGYVTVLVEMITGANSISGLGAEVSARLDPWFDFAKDSIDQNFGDNPFASMFPSSDVAYAIVALYLGLELLTHLSGDRAPASALFERTRQLGALLGAFASPITRTTT